ncbi:MAG: glycosyltransferase family 4 protein [Verrucomicrobiota bacterium]
MAIRIVHTEASLGWGGQEIRIYTEMMAMRERGHELALVAQEKSQIIQRCRDAGFLCQVFSSNRFLYPISILQLRTFLNEWGAEVVNTHSSRDGYIAGIAARLAGCTLVRSRHIDVEYPNRWLGRWAFGILPHVITTTSEKIKTNLVERLDLNPDEVSCVATGIDLQKFSPSEIKTEITQKYHLPRDLRLVGMISVLRSWKGHRYFLEAARKVIDQRNDVHFVIAGAGPMESAIRDWITEMSLEDSVSMIGHQEDVVEVINLLEVLVLPSYAHEGIPQILLQAQAMAKPIVGTKVGGIPEVIQHEVNGLLVEPRCESAIVDSVIRLLEDQSLRKRLALAGRQKALEAYSLEIMCKKMEQLYKRTIAPSMSS